jgi:hypothetical protein
MKIPVLLLGLGLLPAAADVITPAQRFLGIGGQLPAFGEDGGTYRADSPYSAADSDLGVQEILLEHSGTSPVIVDVSTAIYRTDNAPARPFMREESSWMWATRASAAWRPHLGHGVFWDIAATQDFLWFDRSSAVNYENTGLRAGVMKVLPGLDDLVVYGRLEYQRLTTGSFSDGDYNATRLRLGIQKQLYLDARHEIVAGASYAVEYSTRPKIVERNEATVELAHRLRLADNLQTVTSWRSSHFRFDRGGRRDWSHAAGVQLVLQINHSTRAFAGVFYDHNDSNAPFGANDYKSWTGGPGVGLTFSF